MSKLSSGTPDKSGSSKKPLNIKKLANAIQASSDPISALRSAKSKIAAMRKEKKECTSQETEDGRKVLKEMPMPKHLKAKWEALQAHADVAAKVMSKHNFMGEGFWADVREHFDTYGNSLHIDSERMYVQIVEDPKEDGE